MRIAQRKSLSGWERKFHNHLALEREPAKQVRGDCVAGRVLACRVTSIIALFLSLPRKKHQDNDIIGHFSVASRPFSDG